ncbi:hypothetical protein GCM10027592_18480 [Spirosoma flavus]
MLSGSAWSQSVDLADLKKVKLSGGLSVNTLYNSYNPTGADPLSYFVSGNLNLHALGTVIPVSLSYSSRKFTYSQPFSYNQIGIHPTYKWATAHLGMSNMTFSPYSLNGHQFSGVGFDLVPGKWKISTMYGRLVKAQEATATTPAAFQRTGMGLQAGWQNDKLRAGVTTFYAYDNPNSVAIPVRPDTTAQFEQPTPQRNLVIGANFGANLFNFLQFDVEYTNSVLERNRTITEKGATNSPAAMLWRPNATAESYHAVKSTLNANLKRTNTIIGVGYERIDPNYVTLGGYFFTNDFENVTLNFSQPFWSGKISASGSIGVQWDDLKNVKSSAQRRLVGNLNVIAIPTPRLNLSFSYSSFQAYTFIRNSIQNITRLSPLEQLDTLNFTQITQNVSVNALYQLKNTDDIVQTISVNGTVMGAVNKQGDLIRRGQLSQIYNGVVNYSYGLPKQSLTFTGGLNVMNSYISSNTFNSVGPTVGLTKGFLKNTLNTALTASYLHATSELSTSGITNTRLTINYTAKERHSFTFLLASLWQSANTLSEARSTSSTGNFITATLGYTTRF